MAVVIINPTEVKQKKKTNAIEDILFMLMIISIKLYLTLFCAICFGIRQRFLILNRILLNSETFPSHHASLYIEICKIITIINEIYAFSISVYIGTQLLGLTRSLHEIYYIFAAERNSSQIAQTLNSVIFQFSFTLHSFVIIACCCLADREGRKTIRIFLNKFHQQMTAGMLEGKMAMNILQFNHLKSTISCGLFDFNWKILFVVSLIKFLN